MNTYRSVVTEVAERYGMTRAQLIGPSRCREVAWPRQEAMYVMRRDLRLSYPAIGRLLGGLDHSTVMYGVRQHAKRERLPVL